MRKILTFLILALLLTTAPLGAVASPPEDEVLLGYRVVTGYYDIWKHNDGTWQATGKPGDTKTYESEFDFSLANISQELRNQGINTLPPLPHIRFHDFRHLNVTGLIAAGTDIGTVQKQAGHNSLGTTLDYNHPSFQLQKKAVEDFDSLLKSLR